MESLIDPITGGLIFIEKTSVSQDNAGKNANINAHFQPEASKYSHKTNFSITKS